MINFFSTISRKTFYIANQADADNILNLSITDNVSLKFKRGEEFYIDTLSLPNDGLLLSSYGSGDAPVIRGSSDIDTWANEGDGTWSKVISQPLWVYKSGQALKQGETAWVYPSSKPSSNQLQFDVNDLPNDVVGANVYYKAYKYIVWRQTTVQSHNGSGLLTFTDDIEGSNLFGCKFFGFKSYLSSENDWAWELGTLYVQSTSEPQNISVGTADYGIKINDKSSITIEDLVFKNYQKNAIDLRKPNSCVVSNCTIEDNRTNGIEAYEYSNGLRIQNNTIRRCGLNAIVHRSLDGTIIQDNTIEEIGMQGNYGIPYDTVNFPIGGWAIAFVAIDLNDPTRTSNNCTVKNNEIQNISYSGIAFSGNGLGNKIYNNIVHNYLNRFDDGAGIYGSKNVNYDFGATSIEIYNNIVYDAIGSVDGTGESNTDLSQGIYCDNGVTGSEIYNNVVYQIKNDGIYLNFNTKSHNAHDNIIVDCDDMITYNEITSSSPNPDQISNILLDNIFACRRITSIQHCIRLKRAGIQPFSVGGNSDRNYYINPYSANVFNDNGTLKTFSQLQADLGEDENSTSKTNWLTFTTYEQSIEDVKLYTNETNENITVTAPDGYEDIDGNDISGQNITVFARQNGIPGVLILKS